MHTQHQIDSLQAQRASEWFEILKNGREEDRAAFHEWCRKSPLHIQEFLEITCMDRALDALDFEAADDIENLTALLRQITTGAQVLQAQRGPESGQSGLPDSSRRRPLQWTLAAALAGLSVAVAFYQLWLPSQEFVTKIGEQRTVELLDSSVVTLNTNSNIEVQFNDDVRHVELRHGEAVFNVAPDPSRPFRVATRAGIVQAVGTKFNVYDRPEGTDVTVLDGRVRLVSRKAGDSGGIEELGAGEEARIGRDGSIRRIEQADIARVTAWSKRRLKFHNEPLEEIVREFNRYHRKMQLRLENVPAASRHYSGIFDADDPGTLARFLERESDLVVERLGQDIVIRASGGHDVH